MGDDARAVVAERGVLTSPDVVWETAVRRAAVIGRLADRGTVGFAAADSAAPELGVSRRQVYVLLRRWRAGSGLVSDLIPGHSSGGKGGRQLADDVEDVIREALRAQFLGRQRRSLASVYRDVARTCRLRGLPVPSRGAVERRAADLDPVRVTTSRRGADAARRLGSAGGRVPEVGGVLEQVQIDHTVVDLVVVDARSRLPIGRPYVTVAIDMYSRCVVGLVVTLEAPSALSVGLCLAHMVTDKRAWLERVGAEGVEWPMSGKPHGLYLDNAAEFKSEALRRGCDQHGITLGYRPPGRPHYGGIVERVVGTLMGLVHELPGTTFSNPADRGTYDSQRSAALTLAELERWFAVAVATYHGQVHAGLGRTPAGVWADAAGDGPGPVTVTDETAFLVDFLPVIRRTLTRSGFVIDHVGYFADVLKPWIARRDRLDRFVIRRDPRDISRIWVLDPDGAAYVEVGYRTMSRPPVSVWEQQAAVTRLRELGRVEVDEHALFAMVAQMREITEQAQRATRRARRDVERRAATPAPQATPAPVPLAPQTSDAAVEAFAVEEW